MKEPRCEKCGRTYGWCVHTAPESEPVGTELDDVLAYVSEHGSIRGTRLA